MHAPVAHSEPNVGESVDAQATYRFDQISDADLLASTRRLVGRSNQLLANLLAHLAEVEARGIHRLRACSSLYMYCVYELRFSEDAAFRRARAARVARKFPVIFQQVADGELHLTAIVMLAPQLTEGNHRELLALAKHRTKREVLRLVRTLAPEPTLPDRVEPLGPEPVGISMPGVPTWRKLVESLAAGVRELAPGDRPKDWMDRASAARGVGASEPSESNGVAAADPVFDPVGGVPASAERYLIQFTASQEYTGLLERAQNLLSHAVLNRSLAEVHVRALRLLVEQLEKRKYGAPRPNPSAEPSPAELSTAELSTAELSTAELSTAELSTAEPSTAEPSMSGSARAVAPVAVPEPESESDSEFESEFEATGACSETPQAPRQTQPGKKRAQLPRQRGASAVRREVRDRDGLQCTFVDELGQRCRETRFLELHHEHAHALGGGETARNLTMRCQAHNALAAEQDFGREFMRERMSGCFRRRR